MAAMSTAPRCAIVTGGSSGIGRAICKQLGSRGYRVFVTGRNEANLAAVVQEVTDAGGSARFGAGEVSDEASVAALYAEAVGFFDNSSPDVLVANAGVGRFGPLETVSTADFDLSFATNVKGVFLWLRATLPGMKEANAGQIVVMSSVAGLRYSSLGPVYTSTKWALQGLVGSVRENLKGTMVKIGTVNPGSVATPWWVEPERGGKPAPATEERLAKMLTADDVAMSTMHLIDQSPTSNIEMVALDPPI